MKRALLAVSACLLATSMLPQDEASKPAAKPPTGKALTELIDALYAVEPYKQRTREYVDELLAPFEGLPSPKKSDAKSLQKKIGKAWGKLRKLPKKGEHWYWDEKGERRRGRFFVSGKTSKPKGLFIGLHGGGVGSADASGAFGAYQGAAGSRGWLSIYPQAIEATERGWTDTGTEEWIMTLIDEARRTFKIPMNRVYIGGHSMGGYGSWVLGAHHADLFAAAVPSAGAPTPILERGSDRVVGIQEGVVPNLLNLPMCVFQSTDDPRVPADVNQAAVAEVEKHKARYGGYENFTYWEVTDKGHAYPDGGTDALLERIEDFERNPHPDHVLWQPTLKWRTSFYWLDWKSPRTNALIDARLNRDANTIDVTTDGGGVKDLAVLLSADIVDMEKEVVITLDEKEVFRGIPPTSWATYMRTAITQDEGRLYVSRIVLAP